jgi:hypothetical protein
MTMNQEPVNTIDRPWLFKPTKRRDSIIAARIPSALEKELVAAQQRRSLNRSDVVVAALEAYLLREAS